MHYQHASDIRNIRLSVTPADTTTRPFSISRLMAGLWVSGACELVYLTYEYIFVFLVTAI